MMENHVPFDRGPAFHFVGNNLPMGDVYPRFRQTPPWIDFPHSAMPGIMHYAVCTQFSIYMVSLRFISISILFFCYLHIYRNANLGLYVAYLFVGTGSATIFGLGCVSSHAGTDFNSPRHDCASGMTARHTGCRPLRVRQYLPCLFFSLTQLIGNRLTNLFLLSCRSSARKRVN